MQKLTLTAAAVIFGLVGSAAIAQTPQATAPADQGASSMDDAAPPPKAAKKHTKKKKHAAKAKKTTAAPAQGGDAE